MSYIFIIDTDEYSGNFERDLCGYITGCVGDCEVGQEYADKFFEEMEGTKFIDEDFHMFWKIIKKPQVLILN